MLGRVNYVSYFLYTIFSNARITRPIIMLFAIEHRLTLFEFGMTQMGYFAVRFLCEFPTGILADIWKRKYLLSFGSILASTSSLLYFLSDYYKFSNVFVLFFLFSCISGAANAFQSGLDEAMMYDYMQRTNNEGNYVKVMGWRGAISSILLGVSSILGGVLFSISLGLPYLWQGCSFLVGAFVILMFSEQHNYRLREHPQNKRTILRVAKSGALLLAKVPAVQFLILLLTLIAASTNAVTMFMQGYFQQLHVNGTWIGLIYSFCTAFSVLASIFSHTITKLTLKNTMILATAMFFFGVFGLLSGRVILVSVGFFVMYIILDLLEPPVIYIMNRLIPNDMRATILSSFGAMTSLLTMIMYPLYGAIGQVSGYKGIIGVMAIITIPLFIYLFWFYKVKNIGQATTLNAQGRDELL